MTYFKRLGKENIIYIGLWGLLFLSPVLSMYLRSASDTHVQFRWQEIASAWLVFGLYLLIFLVHNTILAPLLIYKRKTPVYVGATLGLVVVFAIVQCANKPDGHRPPRDKVGHRHEMPSNTDHDRTSLPDTIIPHGMAPAPPRPMGMDMPDFIGVLGLIGLLGLNLGVKLYFKNEKDRDNMQRLEQQHLRHQLEHLKHQINPHFFMNTLNNIHALVDIDPEKAKASIVELSRMMRYVLYESDHGMVTLQKEVSFLRNYMRLMLLRYSDRVTVSLDIPDNLPDGYVPPLIFVTFVENAFKHGVSYRHDSFVNISLDADGGRLFFKCINSKSGNTATTADATLSEGGVGLKNVKQRLDLIYGQDYEMTVEDKPESYDIELCMPLNTKQEPLKHTF